MIFSYLKNSRGLWIFSVFYILLFSVVCYFLFLQATVAHYQCARKNKAVQLILLKQKENLAKSDVQTTKELNNWQQKHPHFYATIQSNETVDQLLQLLTHIAQRAGFTIVQAAPVLSKKKFNDLIQLQLSGTYQNLFYLINQLSNTAWPITLTQLKIPQAGQLDCLFRAIDGSGSGSGKLK